MNLSNGEKAFQNGSEHSVNVFKNPVAYAMADNSEDNSLFLAHNHPSTQTFSYSDLGVFLSNNSIGAMSVVSNTGDVHILMYIYYLSLIIILIQRLLKNFYL